MPVRGRGCLERTVLAPGQHTSPLRSGVVLPPAALAQLPGGSVFRRLSQEVEAAAAERQGGIKVYQLQVRTCSSLLRGTSSLLLCAVSSTAHACNTCTACVSSKGLSRACVWHNSVFVYACLWRMLQPLFVPRTATLLECRAAQLVSAVLIESAPNLPGAGAVSQETSKQQLLPFVSEQLVAAEPPLVALQRLYQQESELSVQPLRHPRMMQLLLSGVHWQATARSCCPSACLYV